MTEVGDRARLPFGCKGVHAAQVTDWLQNAMCPSAERRWNIISTLGAAERCLCNVSTKDFSPGHVPSDLMFGLCSCLWSSRGYFCNDHTCLTAVALPGLPNTWMTSYKQNGGASWVRAGKHWVKSFLSVKLQSVCIIQLLWHGGFGGFSFGLLNSLKSLKRVSLLIK